MAKHHLITFGHSPTGSPDPGAVSGNLKEAIEIRRLEPYLKKWAKKSKDSFTFYEGDMYADRSMSKQTKYDSVNEFHLDGPSGSGGHIIIFRAYNPDDIDNRLRDVVKHHFGIVRQNTDGIDRRSNLYNVNEAARAGINYRLIELFFLSNKKDHKYYLENLDLVAKDLIQAITGEELSGKTEKTEAKPAPKPKPSKKKTSKEIAQEVISSNKWGNGETRKQRLRAAGYNYDEVQGIVNDIVLGRSTPTRASAEKVAQDIASGRGGWGNDPGRSRKLRDAGYDAKAVQRRVNDIIRGKEGVQSRPSPIRSSVNIESLAKQVVRGIDTRGRRIPNGVSARAKHFGISDADMQRVQKRVNQLMS